MIVDFLPFICYDLIMNKKRRIVIIEEILVNTNKHLKKGDIGKTLLKQKNRLEAELISLRGSNGKKNKI